jgi:geranylgeranyl diphosphate synthase type 3
MRNLSRTERLHRDYIPLVNLVGVYFQIRDDYMNLQSDEYSVHKGFAEDLTEGKFSFPVVHGIHADKSNRKILSKHLCTAFPFSRC